MSEDILKWEPGTCTVDSGLKTCGVRTLYRLNPQSSHVGLGFQHDVFISMLRMSEVKA